MPDRATELLDALIRTARAAARSPSADSVHDLRVAIRRFTAALAMRKILRTEKKQIRSGLKQVMQSAGNVRDYDIVLQLTGKAKAGPEFLERLAARRTDAARILARDLRKWLRRTARLLKRVAALQPKAHPDRAVRRAAHRFFERSAETPRSNNALHRLRIAAKELRYTLELLAPAPRLTQLKELQTRLGEIHDYETARRIACDEAAGKRVVRKLAAMQRKKTQSFRKKFRRDWDRAALHFPPDVW